MKIKILSGTSVKGMPVEAGRVISIDKIDAQILIGLCKAEPYIEQITRERGGEKPPAPKKRGRKKKDG